MAINYKKELEAAAKGMILVHNPDLLIKMIARTIVQKAKVTHAGILLHDKEKDTYILTVSRGPRGIKIPAGFARLDKDNAVIRYLSSPQSYKEIGKVVIVADDFKKLLSARVSKESKELIEKILYQMEMFQAKVCIPSFFRNELLGVLILGEKRNRRPFLQEELDFFFALASDAGMAIQNARLFQELQQELEKNKKLFINTTQALAGAIEAKDHYTKGHTERVTELAYLLGQSLQQLKFPGVNEDFLSHLRVAALLHDIGKIGIPEAILNKNGFLNEEERKIIQQHPLIGARIIEPISELAFSNLGIKYHHERYDGSGYPEGLKGEAIPLIAAIISVADCFDAMTTDRPYHRAFSSQEAINEIVRLKGAQFNPQLVDLFVELFQQGRI